MCIWRECRTGIHTFRYFYQSLAGGRTLMDPETQPTVPKFHDVSEDSFKAGAT